MPVGTLATVKAIDSLDVSKTKASILLANTYHLYLQPTTKIIQMHGGLHQFMKWEKPILTDSGGFQVFSLGKQLEAKNLSTTTQKIRNSINEDGVTFTSHLDGSKHEFKPETAIQIQREIGADIIMAFDECTPDQASFEYAREALNRTHRWAKRCFEYWEAHQRNSVYGRYQALFGIVQGAMHKELRRKSTQFIRDLHFDGIAFGGETIGYNMTGTVELMEWVRDLLPENQPRYAMGLGRDPQNIIDAIMIGFDMFDCVAPTRLARNGTLYYGQLAFRDKPYFVSPFPNGRLQIENAQWKEDQEPIQSGCDCYTCLQGYSRSYLRHLFKTKELAYYRLASIHNVRFMIRLCEQIREWIVN